MKRVLLFLSSFIIVVGTAGALWVALGATPFQRDYLRALCGNTAAQYHTAVALEKDNKPERALRWYRTAAEKGHVGAQIRLARCAFLGLGMAKDEAEGAAWVKKAADSGEPEAVALMGILYLGGIGVPQDHDIATKWLKKSTAPEAKDLAARLEAENTILDALPPEARAEKWKTVYAGMEAGIRAAFEHILAKDAPEAAP